MSVFSHSAFDDHEAVHFLSDAPSGLKAIIAVHSTVGGRAAGGCRMWNYASDGAALQDVLRLSRGMSYKNAMADLPLGGGKSVILGSASEDKSEALFRAFGRAIEQLGGQYITAEDVGITVDDMAIVAKETSYVSGLPQVGGGAAGGDPSPKTARGIMYGIQAAVRFALHTDDLKGLTVAVQGLGNVGWHLCEELHKAGAKLIVADIDPARVVKAKATFGATAVDVNDILNQEADVLAPCALGGVLNSQSIPRLQARIVAGAANNQLLNDRDGDALREQNVLYAPDYVINAGGIINVTAEYLSSMNEADVMQRLQGIGTRLTEIFERAEREGRSTSAVADEMARARLQAMRT